MKNGKFDLVVVGGGVSGAAIAWDASLRGIKTALIEKTDFGHGTSSATTKLIHGGLRYLAKYQFSVVRESLGERRRLLRNMPHLAFPLPFLLPIYKENFTPRWMLKLGMVIYDIFSYDKNELPDPDKFLSNHKWLNREEALKREPHLNAHNLIGAFTYYDALNKFPERANLEYVLSADSRGAVCANYTEAQGITKDHQGNITGVVVQDNLDPQSEPFTIETKAVINSTGPWGEVVTNRFSASSPHKIVLSKGSHFIVPKVNSSAVAFETKEGRHFFVIPWLDYSLIGTTDREYKKSPDDVHADEGEIEELIKLVNTYLPVNLTKDKILHTYSGVRPLISKKNQSSTYELSRKHEIINHRKTDGIKGFFSVYGGKWTTSRALAQEVLNLVIKEGRFEAFSCKTRNTAVQGGEIGDTFSHFIEQAMLERPANIEEATYKHLAEYYGANYTQVVKLIENQPVLAKRIDPTKPHCMAEIHRAVEAEQCVKLSDFMLRRSTLGNEGCKSKDVLERVAKTMGSLLGWSDKKVKSEIAEYAEFVRIRLK